jgi:hypothetical protein
MRHIASSLLTLLLSGCVHALTEADINGIWINQQAIDAAAAQDSPLLNSLYTFGPNLEWNINTKDGKVRYLSNGFEIIEGTLLGEQAGRWRVDFSDHYTELKRVARQLKQSATPNEPEQWFSRAQPPASAGAPLGTLFKHALYAAYMGGAWAIIKGPGTGNAVHFTGDGKVSGLPGADRYALCLGGDCADMNGDFQNLWLAQGAKTDAWLFTKKGKQLDIFHYLNTALPDEKPRYVTTTLQWRLEKQ